MVAYISKREKVRKRILDTIIPQVEEGTSLDYKLSINVLSLYTDSSKNLVADILSSFESIGRLKIKDGKIMPPEWTIKPEDNQTKIESGGGGDVK